MEQEKVSFQVTEEEAKEVRQIMDRKAAIQGLQDGLADKMAEAVRDNREWWNSIVEKYGIEKGLNLSYNADTNTVTER